MTDVSKSKIISFLQCPKKLWLEIHHKELIETNAATQANFDTGNQVGELARQVFDPTNQGIFFDMQVESVNSIIEKTRAQINGKQILFEAGFSANGARSFADVMLPEHKGNKKIWAMIEVKSSSEVKPFHLVDAAIQSYIARSSGVNLSSVSLAHIDKTFVYKGNNNYNGFFKLNDLTQIASEHDAEVEEWINKSHQVIKKKKEPNICTGTQCSVPYPCGFIEYCSGQENQSKPPKFPVEWLPSPTQKIKEQILNGVQDMRKMPNSALNKLQKRVKHHTINNTIYFDKEGAQNDLATCTFPLYFLDFETINLTVPIWKGRRPSQRVAFQFSIHQLSKNNQLTHQEYLDISGNDPAKELALALIKACGQRGSIFAYHAPFEISCIKELANQFPHLQKQLLSINQRIIDLKPIAKNRYYHPSQEGSWSIKKVLPAIVPTLSYQDCGEVQGGTDAMNAYIEAIASNTRSERKNALQQSMLEYCKLDTLAMVHIWAYFSGNKINDISSQAGK